MMNFKLSLLAICLFLLPRTIFCQSTTLCIPYGTPASIDGIVSTSEWSDADTIQITISGSQLVTVRFKHDSLNLYLAYLNNLESAFRFPEVMFDINNDKSASWLADDWWLHVSATDCESNGTHSNYNNCLAVQPGWEAVPNTVTGLPNTDTIEIKIPFTKVGINLSTTDTIGLAFDVTNTFNAWNYWPSAANINNPSTWANAVFCSSIVGIEPIKKKNGIEVFPNPFSTETSIRISENYNHATLTVYNSLGEQVIQLKNISEKIITLQRDKLPSGLYHFCLTNDSKIIATKKFVITD